MTAFLLNVIFMVLPGAAIERFAIDDCQNAQSLTPPLFRREGVRVDPIH
jgi:hypothetical protein